MCDFLMPETSQIQHLTNIIMYCNIMNSSTSFTLGHCWPLERSSGLQEPNLTTIQKK